MNSLILSAATGRIPRGFNAALYRYQGIINIGWVQAGGEEYGYLKRDRNGTITPDVFDGRVIERMSWKRKGSSAPADVNFTVTVQGTTRPNINEIVLVKDNVVLATLTAVKGEGTYGMPSYTIIYNLGDIGLPIADTVELYIR